MALAVNDETLTRVYSALTTAHFYEASVWGALGSRNYEANLQSAYSTLIQTETFNTTVANRTRAQLHAGFVSPTEPSTASQTMEMDQAVETAQDIPMLDRLEGVLGAMLFDRASREAGVKMANHVDDYFGARITGVNFAAADKTSLGSNANSIEFDTFQPKTTAARDLILDAAQRLIVWARRKNLTEGIQIGGPSLSDLYIVMQPELGAIASRSLLDRHGQGNMDEVRGLVRQGILRYDTVMIGRVFGVDLYVTVKLNVPANAGAGWKFYGGVRQGVEFAARPLNTRYVDARTRESGGWVDTMGSMMQYAGKVVNPNLLHEFTINSAS